MENATKALLIAAAVLIVIILIALGVNLLNSAGDTTEQAEQVGGMLKEETESASGSAIGAISGLQGGSSSGGSVEEIISFNFYYATTYINKENYKIVFNANKNMSWGTFCGSDYNSKTKGTYEYKFEKKDEYITIFNNYVKDSDGYVTQDEIITEGPYWIAAVAPEAQQ